MAGRRLGSPVISAHFRHSGESRNQGEEIRLNQPTVTSFAMSAQISLDAE